MRPLDVVLQDASAILGQVGALLERCRALRLELDAERTPAPDVTTQAERAVYAGMLTALERGLIRALEAMLADLKAPRMRFMVPLQLVAVVHVPAVALLD